MKITYTNQRRDLIDIVINGFPLGAFLFSPRDTKIWLPVCLVLIALSSVFIGFDVVKVITFAFYGLCYLAFAFIFFILLTISQNSLAFYFRSNGSNYFTWFNQTLKNKKKFIAALFCFAIFFICILAIRDLLKNEFREIDLFLYIILFFPVFYLLVFWKQKEVGIELYKESFTIDWGEMSEFKGLHSEGQKVNFSDLKKYLKTEDTLSLYSGPLNEFLLVIPLRAFDSKKDFEYFYEKTTSEIRLPDFEK